MVQPTRREFLKSSAALAVSATAFPATSRATHGEPGAPKPNLLIIQTDQQSCWTIGAYGGDHVETPHIDSLAREGALCENFFTNSAVCTPSRGCFLTGLYPHQHGAYRNNLPLSRNADTLASTLRAEGYRTGYAGKWHLDGDAKPGWVSKERAMGFEDSRFMFNRGHWKTIVERPQGHPKTPPYKQIGDETTYTTDWLASKTIAFLEKRREEPFFFMVAIPDPHTPFTVRAPYDAMYRPEDMSVPATLYEENRPAWTRNGGLDKLKKKRNRKQVEAWLRERKARYCGMVKCIDDNVGRILAAVEESGLAKNTIVVFTTDHGEYLGEHGLMSKNRIYETAYRLPLLVRWPTAIPAGTVVRQCVAIVDVPRTLLTLMGPGAHGTIGGRDGSPLLRGEERPWIDEAHLHHSSLKRAGIFTDRYELCLVEEGGHVLFDRKEDPEQVRNLFDSPDHRETREELTGRVLAHHREVDSPAMEWLKRHDG